MSREHIVSNSVLKRNIEVKGFPWCKDSPKRITAATLTSKILCTKHNASLSHTDAEARKFIDTFQLVVNNADEYGKNQNKFSTLPIRFVIDGEQLEKWFCKTLINVAFLNSADAIIPVDEVLPYLYQGKAFEKPYGLNFAVKVGHVIDWKDGLQIESLFHTEQGKPRLLVGCLVILRSFRFVVLIPSGINPIIDNALPLRENKKDWEGMQLNWHNKEVRMTKPSKYFEKLFQVVSFQWK